MADEQEFTVRDRRTTASEPAADAQQKQQERPSAKAPGEPAAAPLPDMDFSTFVISLASTAQMSLGALPHPETNKTEQNLPAAKQMIDILALMQEKTKGNLTKDEEALLEQVLFNLRMHYVRTAEGQKKSGR